MKVSELVDGVKNELENEKVELVKSYLGDRLEELEVAKVVYEKLTKDYEALLDKDVSEMYYDLLD